VRTGSGISSKKPIPVPFSPSSWMTYERPKALLTSATCSRSDPASGPVIEYAPGIGSAALGSATADAAMSAGSTNGDRHSGYGRRTTSSRAVATPLANAAPCSSNPNQDILTGPDPVSCQQRAGRCGS
jgi:hypothetical protein